jgi:hypothetical protein
MGPGNKVGGVTGKGFLPGKSGNAGGRPRTSILSDAYREILQKAYPDDVEQRTYAQIIAVTVAEQAVRGNTRAIQELADRTEGKPCAAVEVISPSENLPVEMLTDQQLKEIILAEVMRRKSSASQIERGDDEELATV